MVTVEHVREELGSPSHEDISDATLARLIEEEKTLYGAASRAAYILARKYAMQCDYARGNVRESLSQISKAWRELAAELENKAAVYSGSAAIRSYAPGLNKPYKPDFWRGMFDNNYT